MTRPANILSPKRRALLAKVHLLAKDARLEDDDYRSLLERETGRRSAAALSDEQLVRFCDVLTRHAPSTAAKLNVPFAGKIKALWISAWHLGIARSNTDEAAIAFVKRQTGIDHARWLINAADANKVIEGLKQWLARQAGVQWNDWPQNPRRAVAEAQVRRLDDVGDIRAGLGAVSPTPREAFLED
ncbi:MAG: regulatory protein GemA, partial [Hyphomicrobium sp.]